MLYGYAMVHYTYMPCVLVGGTIGDISVDWVVNTQLSNASHDTDYIADGATLNFPSGEAMRGSKHTTIHVFTSE